MVLNKLKESPKLRTLKVVTIVMFIPFLAITLAFCINELILKSTTGFGVLDFELAWTPEMVNTIFTAWSANEMQKQITMTFLDLFYAPCYGFFGMGCILFISRKVKGKFLDLGVMISLSTVIAGIFDEIENANLLGMLGAGTVTASSHPLIASICASLKIGFIGLGLSYLYIGFIYWIIKRKIIPMKYRYILLIAGGVLVIGGLALWNLFVAILIGPIYLGLWIFVEWWVKDSFKGR